MGLRVLSKEDYLRWGKDDPYYEKFDRWKEYLSPLSEIIAELDLPENAPVLELGAYRVPLVHGSVLLDEGDYAPAEFKKVFHDASHLPWPFLDNQFELVIASHMLEHLEPAQTSIFREIRRISRRYFIVAIPFRWKGEDGMHNDIDLKVISRWMEGTTPLISKVVNPPHYRSWLAVYDFEK